jgi:hypothetical protein
MTSPTPNQPGWHSDPRQPDQIRYWDGSAWTEHTAPAAPISSPSSGPPNGPPAGPSGEAPPASHPTPENKRNWFMRHKILSGVLAVVLLFAIIGALSGNEKKPDAPVSPAAGATPKSTSTPPDTANTPSAEPSTSAPPEPSTSAPEPSTSAPPAPQPKPSVEDKFMAVVADAQEAGANASNEIGVVQARTARGTAICKLLGPSLEVKNWGVGTISTVETELGGDKGVIAVDLGNDVKIATWNNSFSDTGSNTMIDPNSKLYSVLGQLSEGDDVTFSGHFVSDRPNCLEEQSIMDENGVLTPTFSFRFDAITKR